MSEYTPGPWLVRQNAIGKPNIITDSWEPVILAVCVYDDGNPCAYTAMSEADARLISAAPYMLAALREVIEWWDGDEDGELKRAEPYFVTAARAAIAKGYRLTDPSTNHQERQHEVS